MVRNTTSVDLRVPSTRIYPVSNHRNPRPHQTRSSRAASDSLAWGEHAPNNRTTALSRSRASITAIPAGIAPIIGRNIPRLIRVGGQLIRTGLRVRDGIDRITNRLTPHFIRQWNNYRDEMERLGDWSHIAGIWGTRLLDEIGLGELLPEDNCITRYLNPFDIAIGRFQYRSIYRERCRDEFDGDDDEDDDDDDGTTVVAVTDKRCRLHRKAVGGMVHQITQGEFYQPPGMVATLIESFGEGARVNNEWHRNQIIDLNVTSFDGEGNITNTSQTTFTFESFRNFMDVPAGTEVVEVKNTFSNGMTRTRVGVRFPSSDHITFWQAIAFERGQTGWLKSFGTVVRRTRGLFNIRRVDLEWYCDDELLPPVNRRRPRRPPPLDDDEDDDEDDDMSCCRTVRQNNELLRRIYREMCSCDDIERIVNPSINYSDQVVEFQELPNGVDGAVRMNKVISGDITLQGKYQDAVLEEIWAARDSIREYLWSMYSFLFDMNDSEMNLYAETWKDRFFGQAERPAVLAPEPDEPGQPSTGSGGGSFGGGSSGGGGAGNDAPEPDGGQVSICWVEVKPHAQSRLHIIDETNWVNLQLNAEMLCAVDGNQAGCSNLIPLMPDERFAQIPVPTQLVLTFGTEYPTQYGSLWHMSIPVPNPAILQSSDPWGQYFEQIQFERGGEVLMRIYWNGSKMWSGCYVKDEDEADKLQAFVEPLASLNISHRRISKGGRRVAPQEVIVRCVRAAYVALNPDRTVNELFCYVPPR